MVGRPIDDVLVVAKTHLDVGFTDLAATVLDAYLTRLVPGALATARRLREAGEGPRLCWTVGSWLVVEALERADGPGRRVIEEGIEAGDLAWHALPFTTHTALLDPSLARYGVSLSARLDERFGRRTVAAKMTDVPGHTRGLVPLLAEAGVRLLHLGVNPASTPPDVPAVFRWRDRPSGTEVVVIYQRGGYGGEQPLPGTKGVLVVDHTGDNIGPPTVDEVRARWAELAAAHPGACVRAARLDDAWAVLEAAGAVEELPVVEGELGDTWLHGAASDPAKVAGYRALSRVRAEVVDAGVLDAADPAVERVSRSLLAVAEHTWGLDVKTHLGDTTTWTPDALAEARRSDPRFAAMERSWHEQRDLVQVAADALAATVVGADAERALAATRPVRRAPRGLAAVEPGQVVAGRHASIAVDRVTGALQTLRTAAGRSLAGRSHPIGRVWHQTYSAAAVERWYVEYVQAAPADEWWARQDQTKPGLGAADAPSHRWQPTLASLHAGRVEACGAGGPDGSSDGPGVVVVASLTAPPEAVDEHGCPAEVVLTYALPDDEPVLQLTVDWFAKRANRRPEALWVQIHPKVADPAAWRVDVLGTPVSPWEVVRDGGRGLHGVWRGVACPDPAGPVAVAPLDAALVAPGEPMLLRHVADHVPDVAAHGWSWLLFDNVWGTNFPMWSLDPDGRARFTLRWDDPTWW